MSPGWARSGLLGAKRRVRAPVGSRTVSWEAVTAAMGSRQVLRVERGGGMTGMRRSPSSKPAFLSV